jgi:hypothetical protein
VLHLLTSSSAARRIRHDLAPREHKSFADYSGWLRLDPLIPTDVEDGELPDLIRRRKSLAQMREVREVVVFH